MRRTIISVLMLLILYNVLYTGYAWQWVGKLKEGDHIIVRDYDAEVFIKRNGTDFYAIIKQQNNTLVYPIYDTTVSIDNTTADIRLLNNSILINVTSPQPLNFVINPIEEIKENSSCSTVEECRQLIAKLKKEKAELEKQLQQLQQQLELHIKEKEQLIAQIDILRQEIKEKDEKIKELEAIIEELEKRKISWKGIKTTIEDWYLAFIAPYAFPLVLFGFGYGVSKWRRKAIKEKKLAIEMATKKILEEMKSRKMQEEMLSVKIDRYVEDKALLHVIKTIVPQITKTDDVTKYDILRIDTEEICKRAKDRYGFKQDKIEYLRFKIEELKQRIKEEIGEAKEKEGGES